MLDNQNVELTRMLALVKQALEPVSPIKGNESTAMYVLECRWSYDKSNVEFVTITHEASEGWLPFEKLLDPATQSQEKVRLLNELVAIYNVQVPTHGGHSMVRLYRVVAVKYLGYDPNFGLTGSLRDKIVDIHWVLKPICSFDDEGNPVPCEINQ